MGLFLLLSGLPQASPCQEDPGSFRVCVRATLDSLIRDEDTDKDRRITIDDPHVFGSNRGDRRFWFSSVGGRKYEVSGTYFLSNLLQELTLAEEAGRDTTVLEAARVFEQPVDRFCRMIKEYFWAGLTRRVDAGGLPKIITDEKTTTVGGYRYLYVPSSDKTAWEYFSSFAQTHPELKVKAVRLPRKVSGKYVRELDGHHGLLTLALRRSKDGGLEGIPFVVPGGRFNEMYGWDSYFIALGLLADGRVEVAKGMVDNFVYEIAQYGKILNANRTYYLTRSQPPFLTSMIRAVYAQLPRNDTTKLWLRDALEAAISDYTNVWMGKDHMTRIGLSRYFDTGDGPAPEVEPGHFDPIYAPYARKHGMDVRSFERAYLEGKVREAELDTFFIHDRAMRESGHDTSNRLVGVCADLVTVDLNSLLFKIEHDIGEIILQEFNGTFEGRDGKKWTSADWYSLAGHRRQLVNRYLWNAERGLFVDYDVTRGTQESYVSATTFYPLWAGLATKEQAASLVEHALPPLEVAGGIAASSQESRGPVTTERPQRQWDYPYGWAPHQMILWQGLKNYGYVDIARRLAYRWLYTITSNAADYNGTVPEKFDLVNRTHRVFAEYGNVGTEFSYITREGFGWTNASYVVGVAALRPEDVANLNRLIPPEWVFP